MGNKPVPFGEYIPLSMALDASRPTLSSLSMKRISSPLSHSQHLDLMRKEGAIEEAHPREVVDCTMNLVIIEKKAAVQIHMNVDATPINQGIKMTTLGGGPGSHE